MAVYLSRASSSRTLSATGMPSLRAGAGTGSPIRVTIGTTPAHVSMLASGRVIIAGRARPDLHRSFVDRQPEIAAAFNSCAFG
jgi:hypothetical protein